MHGHTISVANKVVPKDTISMMNKVAPEGGADIDKDTYAEKYERIQSGSVSALCILRAFTKNGYPVVGWFWWCVAFSVMLFQCWIFYLAALWSFEVALDSRSHDHSVKLPDGMVLQTTQVQDFNWKNYWSKMYEELFKRAYEYNSTNSPEIKWNKPDFNIDGHCKNSLTILQSYGTEKTLTLVFYCFCFVTVLESFLKNISHGVNIGTTSKNFVKIFSGELFCVLLISVEGLQLLIIILMLNQTLWYTQGIDIVFNAFAILFIVDMDEIYINSFVPTTIITSLKEYYADQCNEINWYLDTMDLAQNGDYPSCFYRKKIWGVSFSHQSILKIMLFACFIINFGTGLIAIFSELRSSYCHYDVLMSYFKTGEYVDSHCNSLDRSADDIWQWMDGIGEGSVFLLFGFSSNLFNHVFRCFDTRKIKKQVLGAIRLCVCVIYALIFVLFAPVISQHYKNIAKSTGEIKYGTWMPPADYYDSSGWPTEMMDKVFDNDNVHTLPETFKCSI